MIRKKREESVFGAVCVENDVGILASYEGMTDADGEIYFVHVVKKDFETVRVVYTVGDYELRSLVDDVNWTENNCRRKAGNGARPVVRRKMNAEADN